MTVVGAKMTECGNIDDALNIVAKCSQERCEGETRLNSHSSRSHCILRIIIQTTSLNEYGVRITLESVLSLVDLAGSERVKKAGCN
jgi:hypothetical protein